MSIRDDIIREARARKGISYRLDPPPDGVETLDCSLYVLQVAEAAGVPLPPGVRTAEQIRQATVPIGWDEVLPGDLLYFVGTYNATGRPGPDGAIASHIGISLGAGTRMMWDANDAKGVGETNIGTPYWQERLHEARRLPGLASVAAELPQTLRGVDVASWQGNPDWAAVAGSGIAFAITKATQGTGYLNPTFARNWLEIPANGMVRGAYHYAEPAENRPADEAAYFVSQVERLGLESGDLLVLDLEPPQPVPGLSRWALEWLARVEKRTGIRPLIYTGRWAIERDGLDEAADLRHYPLWLAAYQASQPPAPAPWSDVSIWQFTEKGAVPGISGAVDLNRFNGTREQLLALGQRSTDETAPEIDPRDKQIAGLVTAVAHLADVVSAIEDRSQRLAEAQQIREQFVGPKPAA